MLPDWVEKHKKPGTTVKKIGGNYYLYYASSSRVPDRKYPVCVQTYIGKITESGVVRDRMSIDVSRTRACTLGELVPGLEGKLGRVIVLQIRKEWVCTLTDRETMEELEERGICHGGKVVLRDI